MHCQSFKEKISWNNFLFIIEYVYSNRLREHYLHFNYISIKALNIEFKDHRSFSTVVLHILLESSLGHRLKTDHSVLCNKIMSLLRIFRIVH